MDKGRRWLWSLVAGGSTVGAALALASGPGAKVANAGYSQSAPASVSGNESEALSAAVAQANQLQSVINGLQKRVAALGPLAVNVDGSSSSLAEASARLTAEEAQLQQAEAQLRAGQKQLAGEAASLNQEREGLASEASQLQSEQEQLQKEAEQMSTATTVPASHTTTGASGSSTESTDN